jgi:hypothetical protein
MNSGRDTFKEEEMRRRWAAVLSMATVLVCQVVLAEDPASDPLLDLLVKKGVISEEQAAEVAKERAAEEASPKIELPKGIKDLTIGTLAYVAYQDGSDASGNDYGRFTLKRGYINIEKKIAPHFEARISPDTTQSSSGDWSVRLKYLYGKLKWQGSSVISKPYLEVGLAHMPWLDFEEHVNRFRMQDTMFLERNGIFNSADVGVMLGANFGQDLPEDFKKTVNSHYAGRWGSFQVGVYNGGGYHAAENNTDKVIEGRFTLRPMPDVLPGLQVSLLGVSGEGNVADNAPDWEVLTGMLSYESKNLVLTGQYYDGKGNQKGSVVDDEGRALNQDGYSLFTEIRFPGHEQYSVIARYDRFDTNSDLDSADESKRVIAGFAWQFVKGNYWVLDYDRLEHSLPGLETEDRIQLTLQITY